MGNSTTKPARYLSQADFARVCNVSRKSVTKWKQAGLIVMTTIGVDVVATLGNLRQLRRTAAPASLERYVRGEAEEPGASASPPSGMLQAPVAKARGQSRSNSTPIRRRVLVERLQSLDWQRPACDVESGEAMAMRVLAAARAVGLEAVRADGEEDDGHWGGWQLRDLELLDRHGEVCLETIRAGFGFELDDFQALQECREVLDHPEHGQADADDVLDVALDTLPLLAYPFGPWHRPPAAAPDCSSVARGGEHAVLPLGACHE
jgi:hypothetical protein